MPVAAQGKIDSKVIQNKIVVNRDIYVRIPRWIVRTVRGTLPLASVGRPIPFPKVGIVLYNWHTIGSRLRATGIPSLMKRCTTLSLFKVGTCAK